MLDGWHGVPDDVAVLHVVDQVYLRRRVADRVRGGLLWHVEQFREVKQCIFTGRR